MRILSDNPASDDCKRPGSHGTAGVVPALPQRIALVDASPRDTDGSIGLILDDFAEAFEVYARLDADADAVIPEVAHISGASDLSAFDTIVLGFRAHGDNQPQPVHIAMPLESLTSHQGLMQGARLYAIAVTDLYEPKSALLSFDELESLCARADTNWSGGLAASASDLIPAVAHTPRMGFLRRRLSEAIDDLILAVRCGTNAGIIKVTMPVPRFVYRLITKPQTHL